MFINWNDDNTENSPEEESNVGGSEQPYNLTKVYVETENSGSIIGRNGTNIRRVQKIAKTHLDPFTDTMSIISIKPYKNQSLQDALKILQGIINIFGLTN